MKRQWLGGLLSVLAFAMVFPSFASDRSCDSQYFIGRGKTENLSFSTCKDVVASSTFQEGFVINCQRGIVTYEVKESPGAEYMQLGSDGEPIRCAGI